MVSSLPLEFGILFLVFVVGNVVQGTNLVVEIPLGKLEGTVLKTVNGNDIYAFRGIPYAKPPIKELRFKAPEPIEKWNGIHDATEDGHRCIQLDVLRNNVFTGDEDCLFLNVYTTQLAPTTLRPVMVFIHGGGFSSGDGRSDFYGPKRLLDKDIVLVTINYRVSALGFLSTEDSASPGNYGLLDQVEALKWVRDNVNAFGGDPQRVTIFGESAGSASVIYHLLSPLSKGLFHAAIAQSGTATNPWAFAPSSHPHHNAKELAERLNCPTNSSETIVRCLRRRAPLDIAVKSSLLAHLYSGEKNPSAPLIFLPVIDQGHGGKAFLTDDPQRLMESNQIERVPVMIGIDRDEGFLILQLLSIPKGGIENFQGEDIKKGQSDWPNAYDYVNQDVLSERIARLSKINPQNHAERIAAMSNIIGDIFMNNHIDKTIEIIAANGIPAYAYKLTHKGEHTAAEIFAKSESDAQYSDQLNIVTHADELQYLFEIPFAGTDLNEKDTKMADIILTLWTNFAKNRVPSLDGISTALKWTPVQPNHPEYLNLKLEPTMETGVLSFDSELLTSNNLKDEL